MTKDTFVAEVAEKAGLSKKDAGAAVKAFLETVQEALSTGDKISFVGFGSFEVKERAARTGHNPRTGESMEIPAAKVSVFKAGKALKDVVNG